MLGSSVLRLWECLSSEYIGGLLLLYDQLDNHYHEIWEGLKTGFHAHSTYPLPKQKTAIADFIEACSTRLGMLTESCFTVTDLMDDDTTGYCKTGTHCIL